MLKPQAAAKIRAIFTSLVEAKSTFEWGDLVAKVDAAGVPVKNWHDVRGIMQSFINSGLLFRTCEVCEERYTTDAHWGNVNGVVFFPDDDGTGTGSFIWIQHIEECRPGDYMVYAYNCVGRVGRGALKYTFFVKGKAEFLQKGASLFYAEVHKNHRATDRAQSQGWNL